jgi:hypothetical protein
MVTRRTLIGGAAGLAGAATAGAALAQAQAPALPDGVFVHHVYFWLKAPDDPKAREALIAGLRRLAAAPDILWSHIGLPAPSDRDVVDDGYSVSWLAFFADKAAEDRYQVDPIHLKFVEDCSALWERVIVYDTEPAAD